MTEVSILSTWAKKPSRVVPNQELEVQLGFKEGLIERLTGIQRRHYLGEGESLQSLAADVSEEAIRRSGLDPLDLGMMIFYTDVPPTLMENGRLVRIYHEYAPHLQHMLKERGIELRCECITIGGSCVSFIAALWIAYGLIRAQAMRNILIVGAANTSQFLENADKNVVMTFSDGAAASILSASDEKGFLDFYCMTDGSGYLAGSYRDYKELSIDRKGVAEFAPKAFKLALEGLFAKTGLKAEDVDLFIPHQAGLRIIEKGAELAGLPAEKIYLCLQDDGNTGAPALQMALSKAVREGRVHKGDLIVLVGFGTGWHYGATAFYYR
jgi:3-oxoacyl-[acyl-carrier-protein] synthase-3